MCAEAALLEIEPIHVEQAAKPVRKVYPHSKKRPAIREGALRAPWDDPTFDPGAPLPPERTWFERRTTAVAELKAELHVAYVCIGKKRAFPGKNSFRGDALLGYARSLRAALKLWEAELAVGEPPKDAPSSDEIPPDHWRREPR